MDLDLVLAVVAVVLHNRKHVVKLLGRLAAQVVAALTRVRPPSP